MTRINLLPHRELRREQRKKEFVRMVLLALLAGAGLSIVVALAIETRISAQRDRNEFIQRENRELDGQIREIGQLRQEIESLRARQLAVESLQRDRTLPGHLLDDLVRHTPEGVYYRQLRQTERRVALVGMAESNERVSMVLGALSREAPFLDRPELVEIKSVVVGKAEKDRPAHRAYEFSLNVTLKSPTQDDAQAVATSGSPAKSGGGR